MCSAHSLRTAWQALSPLSSGSVFNDLSDPREDRQGRPEPHKDGIGETPLGLGKTKSYRKSV